MHAIFATRGNKSDVDMVIKWLETRAFYLPQIDKDGKHLMQPLSGIVQPIQLWSYVFPEGNKDEVLTTLKFDKDNIFRWSGGNYKMKAAIEGLRIMMGAKRIPEFKKENKILMPEDALDHVSIIPIGVKYDVTCITPDGKTQEAI